MSVLRALARLLTLFLFFFVVREPQGRFGYFGFLAMDLCVGKKPNVPMSVGILYDAQRFE